jgi:hypothetical protein
VRLRLNSWTLWFNLALVGAGSFAPFLREEVRSILITNGVIGLGLRAKTKNSLIKKGGDD